MFITFPQQE